MVALESEPVSRTSWIDQSVGMLLTASEDSLFSIPIWSVLSQLLAVFLLLGIQWMLKRRASRHFELLNEFVCCCMWVWWSVETTLISVMRSWTAGNISLFVRLLVYPYISQAGVSNPCFALYLYYTGGRGRRGNVRRLCVSLLIELLAVPVMLVFCHYLWTLLGVAVSSDHYEFIERRLDYFLSTDPHYGFLYELIPSFIMFLPGIFMSTSLTFNILNSLITVILIYFFDGYTGAFMNPMVALASTLFWHSLSPWDYLMHCVVFWVGPLVATWAAASVALQYSSYQAKHKLV